MASSKFYSYYLRGKQLALIEEDIDDNATWKSPVSAVTDGLEIEYAYSPRYFINETDKIDTQIDTYVSTDGLLKLIDTGDNDYSASPESLSDGKYIVLKKAGKWNGLHKVKDVSSAGSIILYTKCSDSATVQQSFEETIDLYYNVDVLNDENDTIDLPEYLSKALVYYVKAKLAEDRMEIEAKEYFMKEFRAILEKHNSSKVWGARVIGSGPTAIK
jgi:hypothetical protein